MADVFSLRETFEWRGLGLIRAFKTQAAYADFDAELRFQLPEIKASDVKLRNVRLFCAVLNVPLL